jgi:glycosyltransferase involved in cell wall biosynthesis
MADQMRIIQLFAEAPAPAGTGAQARAYHLAKGLARLGELTAALLVEHGHGSVPPDLALQCSAVIQPPAGFRTGRTLQRKRPRWLNALRALTILAAPWRNSGRQLMIAGGGNCVTRAERPVDHRVSAFHALYADLLYTEARACARMFDILPLGSLIRTGEFDVVRSEIVRLHAGKEVSVIWCEHSYLYPLAERLRRFWPHARLVCDAHNVEYVLQTRIAGTMKSDRGRRWALLEAGILKRWEERMLARADLTLCCSEVDATIFREQSPGAPVKVVPNGVDTDHFQPGPGPSAAPTILFSGTAGYHPNDDAVSWFVAEILPVIRRAMPQVRLRLAGRRADVEWGHFAAADSLIEVASDVPDMRPLFRQAWVCVAPLRSGSGTRIKILEAMAMGRAVVSTTVGAEGIELTPDRHLCLADEPAKFAAKVVELLQGAERRREMERAARELACAKYDWKLMTARVTHAFEEHLTLHNLWQTNEVFTNTR